VTAATEPAPTTAIPEPPDGAVVLVCHPITGEPEDAWYRNDRAASDGYGDQHWYPLGRYDSEYPETWADLSQKTDLVMVTGTKNVAAGTHPVSDLTFRLLAETNRTRCQRWHPGFPADSWTGADWSNAMQGEAGEAGNVVKKLRRAELNTRGALDPSVETLREQLGAEIADTVIYADLLAQFYGLDLAEHVARKFNAVSSREGFPERLPQPGETAGGDQ
jgi:NTP pyrophosphatase (non-canonical NTP hydrolase)